MSRRLAAPLVGLVLVVALVLGCHIAWLAMDRAALANPGSYFYLNRTLTFGYELSSIDSLAQLAKSLGNLSVFGRPPAYEIMAVPFVVLGRGAEDVALGVNLLFLALGALALFHWCVLLGKPWAGVLAAGLYLTYPTTVGGMHNFLPHTIVPSLTVITLWLVTLLIVRPGRRAGWALGAMIGLGAMVHPSYVGIVAIPMAGGVLYWLVTRAKARMVDGEGGLAALCRAVVRDEIFVRALLPSAAISGMIIALWYVGPGIEILKEYMQWKGDEIEAYRGQELVAHGFPEHLGRLWYVKTAPAALSLPLVLAGLVGLIRLTMRFRSLRWFVLLSFASVVLVVSLGETALAWWKLAAALPLLALATALAVDALPKRWLRQAAYLLLAGVAGFNLAYVLFGGAWGNTVARGMGARPDSMTCTSLARFTCVFCPRPPEQNQSPGKAIVEALRTHSMGPRFGFPGVLVVDHKHLQASQVDYWLTRYWPDNNLPVRSQGVKTWGIAYNLRFLARARFILHIPAPPTGTPSPRDTFRKVTDRFLNNPPELFALRHETVATIPLDPSTSDPNKPAHRLASIHLVKRTHDADVPEAEQIIEALGLPDSQLRYVPRLMGKLKHKAWREEQEAAEAALQAAEEDAD